MAVRGTIVGIDSPEALEKALRAAYYLADEGLATAAYLGLALGKPLLLEGAPGVGKTEAAKAIAAVQARDRSDADRHVPLAPASWLRDCFCTGRRRLQSLAAWWRGQ